MASAANPHHQELDSRYRGRLLVSVVTALAIGFVCTTVVRAQNEAQVKAGLEVWRSSGCSDCHGPFANGDKERDEAPTGADIRTSKLDAAALKLTISCGRPGGAGMPAFDEGAYKVRPCYDRPLGPPPDDLYPTPRTLTPQQIDAVVAYLQARIVGRGRITRAECLAYYDDQEDMCEDYK
jgi:mono/diheme cytochrome c family protein